MRPENQSTWAGIPGGGKDDGISKSKNSDTQPSPPPQAPSELLAELDAARGRLRRSTGLLEEANLLRNMLCWQIDIADMQEMVDRWKRRCAAHRRRRKL